MCYDVFQDRVYERVEINTKFLQKFAAAPFKAEFISWPTVAPTR